MLGCTIEMLLNLFLLIKLVLSRTLDGCGRGVTECLQTKYMRYAILRSERMQ